MLFSAVKPATTFKSCFLLKILLNVIVFSFNQLVPFLSIEAAVAGLAFSAKAPICEDFHKFVSFILKLNPKVVLKFKPGIIS